MNHQALPQSALLDVSFRTSNHIGILPGPHPESLTQNRSLAYQVLARRRESRRILAIRTQASALAMDASKSLASRRLRPNQANVRSMTQRRGSALNVPTLCERVTISIVHLPRSAIASSNFGPR